MAQLRPVAWHRRLEFARARFYASPMFAVRPPVAKRLHAAALALGAGLLALYAFAAFALSAEANILRLNSSIFDMDVGRVVNDWTTPSAGRRTHVHPLYKLALAPIGNGLRVAGLSRVDAARWMVALSMTLNALLVGRLAMQLAGGRALPGLLAALLCGVSFSSVLLASVPDTASVSCLATVLPLLYLHTRAGRAFTWREALTWGALGVLCIAFTITQLAHWGIALGARATWLRPRAEAGEAPGRRAARWASVFSVFALLTGTGAAVQEGLYPGTGRFYERKSPVRELRSFQRFETLEQVTPRHGLRLANHFVGVNFVAPMPGFSDYVIRRWRLPYWSLSLEEAPLRASHPLQLLLFGMWILVLLPATLLFGRMDRRFAAPLLSVASQFALHLVYGREYILYSPNWHGVLTAVLVAAAWNGPIGRRRWPPLAVGAFCVALAANSLAVMNRVYEEVEVGLELAGRDEQGRRLGPR